MTRKEKTLSTTKIKELVVACNNEKTSDDLIYKSFYFHKGLRISKEISIDVYGNDSHAYDFHDLFSAILGLSHTSSDIIEILKILGFELGD